jgi:hypothetical protein
MILCDGMWQTSSNLRYDEAGGSFEYWRGGFPFGHGKGRFQPKESEALKFPTEMHKVFLFFANNWIRIWPGSRNESVLLSQMSNYSKKNWIKFLSKSEQKRQNNVWQEKNCW